MPENVKSPSKLAINGAPPVRDQLLPYGRQTIDEDDLRAVADTLNSDWLTTGPEVERFEKAIADFVGTKYAVAYSNGTAALHGAYYACGIESGDEIITSGMTFAATGNAALYLGAHPVFADIEPDTGNIDPESVKEKLSSKTKAVVGIDYFGHPCEADILRELAHSNGARFIVDAAHSLGATYKGRAAGSLADMSTFSFHPVKSITTGEGGMVVTDDSDLFEKLSVFRTHGIVRAQEKLERKDVGAWYHEMQELGYNYRITDFQCALGTTQLEKLPGFVERRRQIAKTYRQKLSTLKYIEPVIEREYCQSAYHLFPVLVKKEPRSHFRKMVFEALRAENIGVQVHYIPVYQHPYYQHKVNKEPVNCKRTDAFYDGEISLPIFPAMTDSDVDDVVTALQKIEQELL